MNIEIDVEQFAKDIKAGKSIGGKDGALSFLIKQYPEDIRKVIYTTNVIESVHRQFRNLTKTKGGFPNDNILLKLLFMGIQNASKKWTMPVRNWSLTISQLSIYFEGRLDKTLNL